MRHSFMPMCNEFLFMPRTKGVSFFHANAYEPTAWEIFQKSPQFIASIIHSTSLPHSLHKPNANAYGNSTEGPKACLNLKRRSFFSVRRG